jgi:hypothetical protein
LLKTFIFGLILGVVAAAAALFFAPVVDQHRETSIIRVLPNGGNSETFHINIPMDRIMSGSQSAASPYPENLEWPLDPQFAGINAELFKVRNERDLVIGVASRIAAQDEENGALIEWVLHLPARGSMYLSLQPEMQEGGVRFGELQSGSREFSAIAGVVTERWVADVSGEEGSPAGRIELVSSSVAFGDGS